MISDILLGILATSVAREGYLSLGPRRANRRKVFAQAQAKARELGLPLVVIGNPGGGFINIWVGRDYDCADYCIDPDGCEGCPIDRVAKKRAEDALPLLAPNSAVIYVSCTLEYVDDIDLVWREMRRVAGLNIFTANVEPISLTAFFFPHAQRRMLSVPRPGVLGTPRYQQLPWIGGFRKENRLRLGSR